MMFYCAFKSAVKCNWGYHSPQVSMGGELNLPTTIKVAVDVEVVVVVQVVLI